MRVCHCFGVTDREIREDERSRACGRGGGRGSLAGTGCGGCRPLADAVRDQERAALGLCTHHSHGPRAA